MNSDIKLWIGTSWKMNKIHQSAMDFVNGLLRAEHIAEPQIQRFVIPSFTSVREVSQRLRSSSVKVGAQNMHWENEGAWTGEISPLMLKDCQIDIVELGHSERREHFGETDETVGLKVAAAVEHGLIPLICVGESFIEKQNGSATDVLATQVRGALAKLSGDMKAKPIWFAYEPIWAIGENGIPASPDYADARQFEISDLANNILGYKPPCLYGGSVNKDNCAELVTRPHIDGLFIGRSAWNVDGYLGILDRCSMNL